MRACGRVFKCRYVLKEKPSRSKAEVAEDVCWWKQSEFDRIDAVGGAVDDLSSDIRPEALNFGKVKLARSGVVMGVIHVSSREIL